MRVVKLTERGREVMQGKRSPTFRFTLAEPKESKAAAAPTAATEPHDSSSLQDASATMDLYDRLRDVRNKLARGLGAEPWQIASNRGLQEMAERRPTTRKELLAIHGMGQHRVSRYGKVLLNVIREAIAAAEPTSGDPRPSEPAPPPEMPTPEPKSGRPEVPSSVASAGEAGMPTEIWTRRLHAKGFTIAEIAAIRGLAEATIRQHLLADRKK
jgi:ATP-dependent DNA helicase RecQ